MDMEKAEWDGQAGRRSERKRVSLDGLGERYREYRFSDPQTESRIKTSLAQDGQLSPLIVCKEHGNYQVLDGFKRLRALRELGTVKEADVLVVSTKEANGKALMLRLNESRKGMCMIEEALVLHAMHARDGLVQRMIAQLVRRHPTWVCRRIALVERLHETVLEHMRLGLIPGALGREIGKLPRGNQPELLEVIERHRLNCHETGMLVRRLLELGDLTGQAMEREALDIVNDRKALSQTKLDGGKAPLHRLLGRLRDICVTILDRCQGQDLGALRTHPAVETSVDAACDAAQKTIALFRG